MRIDRIESTDPSAAARDLLGSMARETLCFWLVDRTGRSETALRIRGGPDDIMISLPGIARVLARSNAAYVFMAHNHPSGDPRPSAADIAITRHVWRMARMMGLSLQDHHILSRSGCFSFRAHGLL